MSRAYGSSWSFRKSAAIWMIRVLSCEEIKMRYVFNGDSFGVKSDYGVIYMELIKSEEKWERFKGLEFKNASDDRSDDQSCTTETERCCQKQLSRL